MTWLDFVVVLAMGAAYREAIQFGVNAVQGFKREWREDKDRANKG